MPTLPKAVWGVLACVAVLLGTAWFSWHLATNQTNADWEIKMAAAAAKANEQINGLNATISTLQQQAQHEQEARTAEYLRGQADANAKLESTISELQRTNTGLWLKVRLTTQLAAGYQTTAVQSKRDGGASAQLTTEASATLLRIAGDGDDAIRQLQLCQVEYKSLYTYAEKLSAAVAELQRKK